MGPIRRSSTHYSARKTKTSCTTNRLEKHSKELFGPTFQVPPLLILSPSDGDKVSTVFQGGLTAVLWGQSEAGPQTPAPEDLFMLNCLLLCWRDLGTQAVTPLSRRPLSLGLLGYSLSTSHSLAHRGMDLALFSPQGQLDRHRAPALPTHILWWLAALLSGKGCSTQSSSSPNLCPMAAKWLVVLCGSITVGRRQEVTV
jgi:hypothetical protein